MPAILTVSGRGPETYGSDCPEHPEWSRHGLTRAHALNVVAKHNRESHASPVLNLSAAARAVESFTHQGPQAGFLAAMGVWEGLTGLQVGQAVVYLDAILAEPEDVLVHIAPF